MSAGIGNIGSFAAPVFAGNATNDPRAQARILQNEFDKLLQNTQLRMRVDVDTGRLIVQVIDAVSGDVLRQIPGDEALRLARAAAAQQPAGNGRRDVVA